MKISTLISTVAVAATLTLSSFSASATTSYTYADSSISADSYTKKFDFTGLTAGTYDVSGTFTGTGFGLLGAYFQSSPVFDYFDVAGALTGTPKTASFSLSSFVYDGTSPLTFNLLAVKSAFVSTASYSGTLNFVSAVPEAETYGMMLLGLGLMSFVAYRRRQY